MDGYNKIVTYGLWKAVPSFLNSSAKKRYVAPEGRRNKEINPVYSEAVCLAVIKTPVLFHETDSDGYKLIYPAYSAEPVWLRIFIARVVTTLTLIRNRQYVDTGR